jgi:hypothetical protein
MSFNVSFNETGEHSVHESNDNFPDYAVQESVHTFVLLV